MCEYFGSSFVTTGSPWCFFNLVNGGRWDEGSDFLDVFSDLAAAIDSESEEKSDVGGKKEVGDGDAVDGSSKEESDVVGKKEVDVGKAVDESSKKESDVCGKKEVDAGSGKALDGSAVDDSRRRVYLDIRSQLPLHRILRSPHARSVPSGFLLKILRIFPQCCRTRDPTG
eukprot:CAMPEP_0113322838 /NCGR_PEP_ID=MMETSP0010_2-20120614/15879_1 /TAXON_ID=216773 ORGANISM="Corethron hystrix, Strain 308" /NCGR_SAMPLE_ID=MMETSP0010_2 /ASSEMBLY_ACC=CAM_ASM_000155 /LENGTH=169 /DNA_ID=CAMNT_0000181485 /DNA_START=228 /DNA_END=733 /DNA_ORIENTATION=+ /assembly_acc=CAM_ASM_000155